ncbi:hypothetical protein F0562_028096 [Nyssa sinensis]|uniref:Uncharacterized protein n=1 Tax=Nyssa sinensis TaxID=561372 RepID=A0A5J5B5N3_9ASTE|nr:hypothetical protein F0562_028096 [Nyssa sinensis]
MKVQKIREDGGDDEIAEATLTTRVKRERQRLGFFSPNQAPTSLRKGRGSGPLVEGVQDGSRNHGSLLYTPLRCAKWKENLDPERFILYKHIELLSGRIKMSTEQSQPSRIWW